MSTSRSSDWPYEWGVRDLDAWSCLTQSEETDQARSHQVINLCRAQNYHSVRDYVSLLAEAPGYRPTPSMMTLQDLRNRSFKQ
ncbi:MAG: RimK-like ATPgrasp N-terminal domain-containing protein [Planctomycetaceae bacterium]